MDDAIRERLKPADNTTHAIQLAMVSLHQEQRAAAERLAGLAAEKDELKRTGAHALAKQREADQAAIEAHIRELEAVGEDLRSPIRRGALHCSRRGREGPSRRGAGRYQPIQCLAC